MQLTKDTAAESLSRLQHAQSSSQKLTILRTIKNTLTGHDLRKIEYIRAGLLPYISELAQSLDSPTESKRSEDAQAQAQLQEQDTIWLHIASIVAVIASVGAACTEPILRSGLVNTLWLRLSRTVAPKVRLTILRSLVAIASNLPLQFEKDWVPDQSLARCIYTKAGVDYITRVIAEPDLQSLGQQIKEAALALICRTCSNENHKALLVEAGLLNVLCDQLSQCVNIDQFGDNIVPGHRRESHSTIRGILHFSPYLETIGLLIRNSRRNAEIFASHNGLVSALSSAVDHAYTQTLKLQNVTYSRTGQSPNMPLQNLSTKLDILLPEVMDMEGMRAVRRSSFPPLDGLDQCIRRRGHNSRNSAEQGNKGLNQAGHPVSDESLVVPWLLYLSRSSIEKRRIFAAQLLAILKCHGFVQPARVRSLAALLIPLLVEALDKIHASGTNSPQDTMSNSLIGGLYWNLAPSVLALLIRDQEDLQKAAVDCKAIPRLVTALKANLEHTREATTNLWWPVKLREKLTDGEPDSCLGRGGPSECLRMTMRLREGLLQALAALCPDNDGYRKDVCDQGAVGAIIAALEPFHSQIQYGQNADQILSHGNSPDVLVAACGAVRALSRSPTTLRTKLVDADVSKVIIKLLHTTDPEVRISATMVLANLSHDFSPMKQNISDASVVRKLCEQAHSANARLRLESLFTLKALVTNSSQRLKKLIVDELGCSWIRYLIATDPHDVPQGEVIGLVQRDFRKGTMARFQNIEQDLVMEGIEVPENNAEESEIEMYNRHSLQQDLDIQAEILAFLRNLTTGESTVEIIDYLFAEIGQEELMQILIDRLRDRIQISPHAEGEVRRTPLVPAATVINTLYLLAHLAASDRKYRMMLCNNTPLMRQVSTLFNSDEASVRSACCWVVINLIYPVPVVSGSGSGTSGDSIDVVMARAKELQRLGIRNVVRRMEKTEQAPDVRERAATAAECFGKLLDRG